MVQSDLVDSFLDTDHHADARCPRYSCVVGDCHHHRADVGSHLPLRAGLGAHLPLWSADVWTEAELEAVGRDSAKGIEKLWMYEENREAENPASRLLAREQ